MTPPLVSHLKFDGMTKYGIDILLGRASEIPDLDLHTRRYLHHIYTITRSLPGESHPISLEKYTKDVGHLR